MQELKKTSVFGLVFGLIFSFILYVSSFEVDFIILLLMPFFVTILCVLGSLVGDFVSNMLLRRGVMNKVAIQIISFLSAAFVNVVIVYVLLVNTGTATLHPEVIIGSSFGLIIGSLYMIYSYRMDQVNERMRFLEELSEKNRLLQEASRKLAITEERNRMGRDLHDSVSQGIHGLIFSLHSLRNELENPNERAKEIITYIETTANATLGELRTMIEELKPSLLAEEGLEEALNITAQLFSQRNEIPIEIDVQLEEPLYPNIELAIYRIFQEALANIEKHASATHAYLTLTNAENFTVVTVRDDGKGFIRDKESRGNGLENMRQRVEEEGGKFDLISKPGFGTTIIAKFPSKG